MTERDSQVRHPADYHDYVFQDGKLLGDFDGMYRHAEGIPWDQDKRCEEWYGQVGLLILGTHAPYDGILEIGCGLGYIAAKLKTLTRASCGASGVDAFDISPEAIRRASGLHSGVEFYVDDIARPTFRPRRQYDLVVVRELLWYVCDNLPQVVENIGQCLKPGKHLYVGQSFPSLESAFVGKNILPNPDALMAWFRGFDPIYTAHLRNHRLTQDGPILHFLGLKK